MTGLRHVGSMVRSRCLLTRVVRMLQACSAKVRHIWLAHPCTSSFVLLQQLTTHHTRRVSGPWCAVLVAHALLAPQVTTVRQTKSVIELSPIPGSMQRKLCQLGVMLAGACCWWFKQVSSMRFAATTTTYYMNANGPCRGSATRWLPLGLHRAL